MATEYLFSNNATTTLAQSVSATATVLNVAEGTGALFPSPSSGQAFAVTLVDAATGLTNEICYCTARSGDQLTVVRGREGTNAIAWSAGDTCANYITADVLTSWQQYLSEYLTQPQADNRYLKLDDSSNQNVDSPVTFSEVTLVPSVTDWTQKQAVPASDADARYVQPSMLPFTDSKLRFQIMKVSSTDGRDGIDIPQAFAGPPVFVSACRGEFYDVFFTRGNNQTTITVDTDFTDGSKIYFYILNPAGDFVTVDTLYIMVGGYF